ncbi:hypothetical protein LINPERPRIM_LOCUS20250, partial [Linum perenne]
QLGTQPYSTSTIQTRTLVDSSPALLSPLSLPTDKPSSTSLPAGSATIASSLISSVSNYH